MSNQNSSGKDFVLGAVSGAMIGAATALLLTPKSGRELRTDLAEGYRSVSEKGQDITKTVGAHTTEWAGKATDALSNIASEIKVWNDSRKQLAADSRVEVAATATDEASGQPTNSTADSRE